METPSSVEQWAFLSVRLARAQNAIVTERGVQDDSEEALKIICMCRHAIWQSLDSETMPRLLEVAKAALLKIGSNVSGRDAAVEELQEAIEFLNGDATARSTRAKST